VFYEQRAQNRREQQAREQAQRAEEENALSEARVAARILQGELAWVESRIGNALKPRRLRYWDESYGLRDDGWLAYRERIAAYMSNEDWSLVRDGFRAARAAELQATLRRKSERSPGAVTENGAKLLRGAHRKVSMAVDALVALAEARPEAELDMDDGDEGE